MLPSKAPGQLPEAIIFPSGEKARQEMRALALMSVVFHLDFIPAPVLTSRKKIVPESVPHAMQRPSGENANEVTGPFRRIENISAVKCL